MDSIRENLKSVFAVLGLRSFHTQVRFILMLLNRIFTNFKCIQLWLILQHLGSLIISGNVRKIETKTYPFTSELSITIIQTIVIFLKIVICKVFSCTLIRGSLQRWPCACFNEISGVGSIGSFYLCVQFSCIWLA